MASDEEQEGFESVPPQQSSAEASPASLQPSPPEQATSSFAESLRLKILSFLADRPFKARIRSLGLWIRSLCSPILASFSDRPLKAHIQSLGAWLMHSPFFRTRRRCIVTALVGVPLLLCLSYWLFGFVAFADAASLVQVKGVVQTRQEDERQWKLAHLNQLLWRNHRLRTGAGSGARLLFFDVSSVDLGENTEVSIMQIAKRRGGSAVDVVLKTWVGNTIVRAVRFVDPSSTFRVDTPNASTMVRGARFTVQVAEDGTTQIDLEEGSAEVKVKNEVVPLAMGERITLQPDGLYKTEQVFEPDAQLMVDKLNAAWLAPGDVWRLELTETEVNQFLAAMSQQPDFFLKDMQVWFVDGEARAATTVVKPTRFDVSGAAGVQVVNGEIKPRLKAIAAGVTLPLPGAVLNPALDQVLNQLQDYLNQAYSFVEFKDVQILDGRIVIAGRKRPDAPVNP